MSAADHVAALIKRISDLERRLKGLERRSNNFFREGTIKEVDFASGRAVMEAGGIETPAAPWLTRAGDVRDWNPVSVGERAVFFSPTGDPSQGMILPGGFSDAYPQNSNQGASPRRSIGAYSITETAEGVVFAIGGTTLTLSASGMVLSAGGVTYLLTDSGFVQDGGIQTHNGSNVGSTHTHSGVQRGGSRTDPPS